MNRYCIFCSKELHQNSFKDNDILYRCTKKGHFCSLYFKDSNLIECHFTEYNSLGDEKYSIELFNWKNSSNNINCAFLKENSTKNIISIDISVLNEISEKFIDNKLNLKYIVSLIDKLDRLSLFI